MFVLCSVPPIRVAIRSPEAAFAATKGPQVPVPVLYEDDDLLVVGGQQWAGCELWAVSCGCWLRVLAQLVLAQLTSSLLSFKSCCASRS